MFCWSLRLLLVLLGKAADVKLGVLLGIAEGVKLRTEEGKRLGKPSTSLINGVLGHPVETKVLVSLYWVSCSPDSASRT